MKTKIVRKRMFEPRPFKLNRTNNKQISDYCLLMGYEFDDYTYDYPIIVKDNKMAYVTVICGVLYVVFIDNNTPVFVNMKDTLTLMYGMLNKCELSIVDYLKKQQIYGHKLFHFLLSIIYFEDYDFTTN